MISSPEDAEVFATFCAILDLCGIHYRPSIGAWGAARIFVPDGTWTVSYWNPSEAGKVGPHFVMSCMLDVKP